MIPEFDTVSMIVSVYVGAVIGAIVCVFLYDRRQQRLADEAWEAKKALLEKDEDPER